MTSNQAEPDRLRLAFVHTVLTLAPTFSQLAEELVPNVEVFHIADESLLGETRRAGSLTSITKRRVLAYVMSAVDVGADVVLVTCSSIGPAADLAQGFAPVPVVRVDEPMVDEAVRLGPRIGVLATLSSTLEPTAALVDQRAQAQGKEVQILSRLCDGAFDALLRGDRQSYDEVVREGIRKMCHDVDVIVLAQASMALVADSLPEDERTVPVLSSPRLAMLHVSRLLSSMAP